MQDTLLRVFVVALGLIIYPREDPSVQDHGEIIAAGMQEHEERLQREGEKLDQEMTPINQEITQFDTEERQGDMESLQEETNESTFSSESYQQVPQIDNIPLVDDLKVTLTNHKQSEEGDNVDPKLSKVDHYIADLHLKLSQEDQGNPETEPQPSQIDQEDEPCVPWAKGQFKLDKDSPSTPNLRGPRILPGQQELFEMEEVFHSDQEVQLSHRNTETSAQDRPEKSITDWEVDFLWYLWNTYSIISMIRFLGKYLKRNSQNKHGEDSISEEGSIPILNSISGEVPLPDSDTLHCFYAKCVKISPNETWRVGEFVEGFASDLLEAMRSMRDRGVGMVIEDFQVVEDVSNIIVPFTPPEPYGFQCQFSSKQTGDMPPDMQYYGQIKMVENVKSQNGCHCELSDMGDDILCLLHCGNEKVKAKNTDVYDGPLCMKNTPFLSKSQVAKWFRSTIRQAWEQISHKYEFELIFRCMDAPGALAVRFRSGEKIAFNMNPVVKFKETDGYFFIPPCSTNSDVSWTLSLAIYEDRFLKHLSENLPGNSCHIQTLEILYFLHKKQTELTGRSALKDFHFKTTIMHLLLTKEPSQWGPEHITCRLRDLLGFMEKSLEQRLLNHILIGNDLVKNEIELPAIFSEAKTLNIFCPLVMNDCLYTKAIKHFQEILKNTHVLIEEYVAIKGA